MDLRSLTDIFKALAEPTRLQIFAALSACATDGAIAVHEARCRAALTVGELCCRFPRSLSTISHHLKELREAGLIRCERQGRTIYCSVNPEALALLREFLEHPTRACCPGQPPETKR